MKVLPVTVSLLLLLSFTASVRAAETASAIDQEKSDKSEEDLVVQTDQVNVSRQRIGRLMNTDYDVTAHVLAVNKTRAWVNAGDVLKIHYTIEDRRKQGVNNPPLPMKEKTTYHVYLARNTWNNVYGPAIGDRSFEQVVPKKKPATKTTQSQ